MGKLDLTIVIPARNEIFLSRTIEDILSNIRGDTEIIAVLDGQWAEPPIQDHPKVTLLYYPESIGQRAATNRAVSMSTSKYIMKCDAHCAFDEGFDVKLLEDMEDDWTVAPIMRNLHAFNWVCQSVLDLDINDQVRKLHTRYQGPSGICTYGKTDTFPGCGEPTVMDVVWIAKPSPQSTSYRFDTTLHFQYFNEFKKRPEGRGDLTESMSLQGSCFMLTREKYLELNICDETWGSWGQQGTEVACKTWLSGGRVIINHKTWYAHMFRTQGGDFSFPYHQSGKAVENARQRSRDMFFNNSFEKQTKPLVWLVDKFKPVPDWHDEKGKEVYEMITEKGNEFYKKSNKGIVYYTENTLDPEILKLCQDNLNSVAGMPIVSVSLKPIDFGKNIVLDLERGYLTMFKQILAGLENSNTDIIYFCEHDVLYHKSHFDFTPEDPTKIYYNTNVWKLRYEDGHALHYDVQQTSGLCAFRQTLITHYRERVRKTEEKLNELGNTRAFRNWIRAQGFEPGTHGREERVDDLKSESWQSEFPNVDIRHNGNLTPNRWSQDEFRNKRSCRNWIESDTGIPGWEKLPIKNN